MANIKQFPVIENTLDDCNGCYKPLVGEYWEVQLPTAQGFKNIGLCDSCYDDAKALGIGGIE